MKSDISSNQWYGGLNRRFDRRANLLYKLGYKYCITPLGAMFMRKSCFKIQSISAHVVMGHDNRLFIDAIRNPHTFKSMSDLSNYGCNLGFTVEFDIHGSGCTCKRSS